MLTYRQDLSAMLLTQPSCRQSLLRKGLPERWAKWMPHAKAQRRNVRAENVPTQIIAWLR